MVSVPVGMELPFQRYVMTDESEALVGKFR